MITYTSFDIQPAGKEDETPIKCFVKKFEANPELGHLGFYVFELQFAGQRVKCYTKDFPVFELDPSTRLGLRHLQEEQQEPTAAEERGWDSVEEDNGVSR